MKNVWKWILLFVGVFLAGFIIALPFFGWFGMGWGRMPMMGSRLGYGLHLMGGFPLLGFAGAFLVRCLVPLAIIALLVVGIVVLVRRSNKVTPKTTRTCANCGKPLQEDWTHCPYCGADVNTPPNS